MDYSPKGSSVHGILQARIQEWVAMPSFRGSSWPRYRNPHLSCLLHWQAGSLPLVPPGKPPTRGHDPYFHTAEEEGYEEVKWLIWTHTYAGNWGWDIHFLSHSCVFCQYQTLTSVWLISRRTEKTHETVKYSRWEEGHGSSFCNTLSA